MKDNLYSQDIQAARIAVFVNASFTYSTWVFHCCYCGSGWNTSHSKGQKWYYQEWNLQAFFGLAAHFVTSVDRDATNWFVTKLDSVPFILYTMNLYSHVKTWWFCVSRLVELSHQEHWWKQVVAAKARTALATALDKYENHFEIQEEVASKAIASCCYEV